MMDNYKGTKMKKTRYYQVIVRSPRKGLNRRLTIHFSTEAEAINFARAYKLPERHTITISEVNVLFSWCNEEAQA